MEIFFPRSLILHGFIIPTHCRILCGSLRCIQNEINTVKNIDTREPEMQPEEIGEAWDRHRRHKENWDPAENAYLLNRPTMNIPLNHHESLVSK